MAGIFSKLGLLARSNRYTTKMPIETVMPMTNMAIVPDLVDAKSPAKIKPFFSAITAATQHANELILIQYKLYHRIMISICFFFFS